MADASVSPWVGIFSSIIAGGGIKYLYDSYAAWRNAAPAEIRQQSVVDASIVTVSRARDQLEEDNTRLRQMHEEERELWQRERDRFNRERAAWETERVTLRKEIEALEAQIRRERAESAERYDRLLDRLAELSARHAKSEKRDGAE